MSRSRTRTLWLAALLALAMSGCARHGGLDKAREQFERGHVDAALVEARNVLQQDALNAEAQLLVGRILAARGDSKGAEREIRKAEKLGMDRVELDAALAQALIAGGQVERLLAEIEAPSNVHTEAAASILAARGVAFLAIKEDAQAAVAFAAALERFPDHPAALLGRARLSASARAFDQALQHIERALAAKPTLLEGWLLKASIALAQDKPEEALAAYDKAIAAIPGSIAPRLAAARLQIATGKMAEAQRHLDHLRRVASKHPLVHFTQALLYFRQRSFAAAQDFAQSALKLAPDFVPATLVLAGSELAQGATEQAEERFRSVLQAFPDDAYVRKLYAAAMLQMNAPDRALQALTPMLGSALGLHDPEALSLAGHAYMQAGDYTQAGEHLERAAAAKPAAAGDLVTLGLRRIAGGEAERGMAELERAARLDSGGVRAELALALTHLRRGEFDQALDAAKRLEAKQPGNPVAFNLAGAAFLGKRDGVRAGEAFEHALALDANYLPAAVNLALLDIDAGRIQSARSRLQAVLEKDRGNLDALSALARLTSEPGELTRLLEQARSADASLVGVRLLLVRQRLSDNNSAEALEVAKEAHKLAPDDPEVLDALGTAQLAAGMLNEAAATYARLVKSNPSSGLAYARLGRVQIALNDNKAAEESLSKAQRSSPEHPEPVAMLARLYADTGREAEALKLAGALRARFPSSPMGYELGGDILLLQRRYTEAAKAFDAGFAVAPNGALAVKHHGALVRAGSKAGSERLQQWLRQHPDDIATRHYLADQQLLAKELSAAAASYRAVLERQPDNAFALNNLANVYHLQKDARALQAAEAAHKLRPDNANILDTLGMVLIEAGDAARALPLLQRAVALNPELTEYRVHLAGALARNGNKEGARAEIKRLLDSGKQVELDESTRALLR